MTAQARHKSEESRRASAVVSETLSAVWLVPDRSNLASAIVRLSLAYVACAVLRFIA